MREAVRKKNHYFTFREHLGSVGSYGLLRLLVIVISVSVSHPAYPVLNCSQAMAELNNIVHPQRIDSLVISEALRTRELDRINWGDYVTDVPDYIDQVLAARHITDPKARDYILSQWHKWEDSVLHFVDRHGWQDIERLPVEELANQLHSQPIDAVFALTQVYGGRNPRSRFLAQLVQWRVLEDQSRAENRAEPPWLALVNYFEKNFGRMTIAQMEADLNRQGWHINGKPITQLGLYRELGNLGISIVDFWERPLSRPSVGSIERRIRNAGYPIAFSNARLSLGEIAEELIPVIQVGHQDWSPESVKQEVSRLIGVEIAPLSNFLNHKGTLMHGAAWDPAEIEEARALRQQGLPISQIARVLMKTESAVEHQLRDLVPPNGRLAHQPPQGPRLAQPHEILMRISSNPEASDEEIAGMFPAHLYFPVTASRVAYWRNRYTNGAHGRAEPEVPRDPTPRAPIVPETVESAAPTKFTAEGTLRVPKSEIDVHTVGPSLEDKTFVADLIIDFAITHPNADGSIRMPPKSSLRTGTHGISISAFDRVFENETFAPYLFIKERAKQRGIKLTLEGIKSPAQKDETPERRRQRELFQAARLEDALHAMADWVIARQQKNLDWVPKDNSPGLPVRTSNFMGTVAQANYFDEPAKGWLALKKEVESRGGHFGLHYIRLESKYKTPEFKKAQQTDALTGYYNYVREQVVAGNRSSWWLAQSEFTPEVKQRLGLGWDTLYRSDNETVPIFENREQFAEEYRKFVSEREGGIDIGFPLRPGLQQ